MKNICVNYFEFGEVVQEEMSSKEKVYGWQTLDQNQS